MILIDIEMPERCELCPCFYAEYPMHCQLNKNKRLVAPYGLLKPDWCPLKEPEAVEPRRIDGKRNHFIKCGNCNCDLLTGYIFCPHCGKAVRWND